MSTKAIITEYCVVPISEIQKRLSEEFQPYGSPFFYKEDAEPGSIRIYQALVKSSSPPADVSVKTIKGMRYRLSDIEQRCIEGLIADLAYIAIAKSVHRSPRTVRNIIGKLRQKWRCQTNVGLILAIQSQKNHGE